MKRLAIVTGIAITVVLVGCSPLPGDMPMNHTMDPAGSEPLTIRKELAGPGQIAFSIRNGEEVVTEYTPTHTKEMHLVVVRDDLEHFQHLHPVRDAKNIWRVPFTQPAAGTYWFFADFADVNGNVHVPRTQAIFSGTADQTGFRPHEVKQVKIDLYDGVEKTVGGYRVQVSAQESADGVTLLYSILDAKGKSVQVEDYLGARGHTVLISKDGQFMHAHPFTEYVGYKPTDSPQFFILHPQGFVRMFTQFQIAGKVLTVDFDWPLK